MNKFILGDTFKRIICRIETNTYKLEVYFITKRKKKLGYLRRKRNKKIQKPCLVNTNYLKKLVTSFDFEHY